MLKHFAPFSLQLSDQSQNTLRFLQLKISALLALHIIKGSRDLSLTHMLRLSRQTFFQSDLGAPPLNLFLDILWLVFSLRQLLSQLFELDVFARELEPDHRS